MCLGLSTCWRSTGGLVLDLLQCLGRLFPNRLCNRRIATRSARTCCCRLCCMNHCLSLIPDGGRRILGRGRCEDIGAAVDGGHGLIRIKGSLGILFVLLQGSVEDVDTRCDADGGCQEQRRDSLDVRHGDREAWKRAAHPTTCTRMTRDYLAAELHRSLKFLR